MGSSNTVQFRERMRSEGEFTSYRMRRLCIEPVAYRSAVDVLREAFPGESVDATELDHLILWPVGPPLPLTPEEVDAARRIHREHEQQAFYRSIYTQRMPQWSEPAT